MEVTIGNAIRSGDCVSFRRFTYFGVTGDTPRSGSTPSVGRVFSVLSEAGGPMLHVEPLSRAATDFLEEKAVNPIAMVRLSQAVRIEPKLVAAEIAKVDNLTASQTAGMSM
jgi:hypothetical protein